MAYLLDTNVAVRSVMPFDSLHGVCVGAIDKLVDRNERLVVASQVLAEAWSLLTRPATSRGGYGLSPDQTDVRIDMILNIAVCLQEPTDIWDEHRRLLKLHSVPGVNVHDCRLAAWCLLHGIDFILTLNSRDFARFGVTAVNPADV
jgi:predicted nucleic acid-binding protein